MRIPLLAAAFLLAACSTPEAAPTQAPATSSTPGQPGNGPNCANASDSVVSSALGLKLTGQRETVDKPITTCRYAGSGATVEVRFTTNASAATFAKARPVDAKAIQGFHDEAYEARAGQSETIQQVVVARKGEVEIQVMSPAGAEPAKKLITELFGRI